MFEVIYILCVVFVFGILITFLAQMAQLHPNAGMDDFGVVLAKAILWPIFALIFIVRGIFNAFKSEFGRNK
jgi:hypothetical protein